MTTPTVEEVLQQIQVIAETELGYDGRVHLSHRLVEDLHLDSLGAIIVAVGLEDHFRVHLQEQDAGGLACVADLVALVRTRYREQESHAGRP